MWLFGLGFCLEMFSTEFCYTWNKKIFKTWDTGGGNADFTLLLNKVSFFNGCCVRKVKAVAFNVTREHWRPAINVFMLSSWVSAFVFSLGLPHTDSFLLNNQSHWTLLGKSFPLQLCTDKGLQRILFRTINWCEVLSVPSWVSILLFLSANDFSTQQISILCQLISKLIQQ